jgi:hypothetical protein
MFGFPITLCYMFAVCLQLYLASIQLLLCNVIFSTCLKGNWLNCFVRVTVTDELYLTGLTPILDLDSISLSG